jgi:hypothetical protein
VTGIAAVEARPKCRCAEDVELSNASQGLLSAIGSPLAVGTALLFYFGWVRTREQSRAVGFSASSLDFSIQEYMLRSIDVLYPVGLVVVLVVVAGQWSHRRHILPLVHGPRSTTWIRRLMKASRWSILGWFFVFALLAYRDTRLAGIAVAGFLAGSLLSALYAGSLRNHLRRPAIGKRPVSRILLLSLLALALFWATEQYARLIGQSYAQAVVRDPLALATVTVYSEKRLAITMPGTAETPLSDEDSAYRFRYDGLRMVQRSGDRYFLIGDGWTPDNRRVVVIREAADVRLEFSYRRTLLPAQ